jgi:RNA polymerase sigma-70 factor, ECF subfamily
MEICVDPVGQRPARAGARAFASVGRPRGSPPGSVSPPAPPRASARTVPAPRLDAESRAWWVRLHGGEPERDRAIAELHERLRREAWFHIRLRTRGMSEFPRSDLDDLAVQAASDALLAVLRKLEDYRGDSQFWTWAKRFAQLEAPVSIRRRLGHDRLANDPERAFALADPGCSPQERAEVHEQLGTVSELIVGRLTARQRSVLIAIAIDGVSTATLASELDTTRGAIYKTLHDARKKLAAQLALC